ncbi:MAG: hypothetical protein ACR2N3_16010, partial [Pyrinomonadaceae bacterium]
MKRFSVITFAFLLFTFAFNIFAQNETRVVAIWQVKKYDISASTADRFLTARAILNVRNVGNGAGTTLTLRISPKAEVSGVTVNGAAGTFSKREEKLGASASLQRIVVNVPST